MISCSADGVIKDTELLARQEEAPEGKYEEIEVPQVDTRPSILASPAQQSDKTAKLVVGY